MNSCKWDTRTDTVYGWLHYVPFFDQVIIFFRSSTKQTEMPWHHCKMKFKMSDDVEPFFHGSTAQLTFRQRTKPPNPSSDTPQDCTQYFIPRYQPDKLIFTANHRRSTNKELIIERKSQWLAEVAKDQAFLHSWPQYEHSSTPRRPPYLLDSPPPLFSPRSPSISLLLFPSSAPLLAPELSDHISAFHAPRLRKKQPWTSPRFSCSSSPSALNAAKIPTLFYSWWVHWS